MRYLDRAKTPLIDKPILIRGERDGIGVEVALWWNDSYHENVLPFTNNIPQRDGGTHLIGLRSALTRQVIGYAESSGLLKKEKVDLSGDDCREGLTCVLVDQVPRSEVLLADQGQAGLLRSAAGRRGPGQRAARRNGSRSIRRRRASSSARWSRRRRRARRRARRAN